MDAGWIKLHRKLLESPLWAYASKANMHHLISLWITLVMGANWEEKKWYDGKEEVLIKPGSLVTSTAHLADYLGLSVRQVRTGLQHLEQMKIIRREATNKWTRIFIVNWDKYQLRDVVDDKRMTNKRQTDDKRMTTTKEYKKERNKEVIAEISKKISCPLLNGLNKLYPRGHKECIEYITGSEELRGVKFINKTKQFVTLHKIINAGWTFEDLDKIMSRVEKKYGDNSWDFTTLANWLEKTGGKNAKTKTNYN